VTNELYVFLGKLWLIQTAVIITIAIGFLMMFLYNILKKRSEYLSLLKLESKIKANKGKYLNLVKKFEKLEPEELQTALRLIHPTITGEEYNNFIEEWKTMSQEEKLKFIILPPIEKFLSTIPDDRVKNDITEPKDTLGALTSSELREFLSGLYSVPDPETLIIEKSKAFDEFTDEQLLMVVAKLSNERKYKIATKQYSLSDIILIIRRTLDNSDPTLIT